ncbi:MAG TPA: phosphoribosyltransferase [Candidatus Dormibacteraeota bacterium]
MCHGAAQPPRALCVACRDVLRQVSRPVRLVVPVSLSTPDEQLHEYLREYKRSRHPDVRREFSHRIAALLARFLATHGSCIRRVAGSSWSAVAVVPSSADRPGLHPLETALGRLGWQEPMIRPLCRGPGRLDDGRASDDGYRVTTDVSGMALLLVDDALVSGARLQSAASALQLAGATVVAGVPVARSVDPACGEEPVQELLARAGASPFDFDECCLEDEGAAGR